MIKNHSSLGLFWNLRLRDQVARFTLLCTLSLAVISVGFLASAQTAFAIEKEDRKQVQNVSLIRNVSLGWDGYCKIGRWTPIRVAIDPELLSSENDIKKDSASTALTVVVIASDPTGDQVEYQLTAYNLEKGFYSGLFQIGKLGSSVRIEIHAKDRVLETMTVAADIPSKDVPSPLSKVVPLHHLKDDAELLLTAGQLFGVAPRKITSEEKKQRKNELNKIPLRVLVPLTSQNVIKIPDVDFRIFDGVDAIILAGNYDVPAVWSEAIRKWVISGGVLLISSGKNSKEYEASHIATWVPIKVKKTGKVSDLPKLESFSLQTTPLRIRKPLRVSYLISDSGRVLVDETNGSILIRTALGRGRITVLGIDLDNAAFRAWGATPKLCNRLLNLRHRAISSGIQNQIRTRKAEGTGVTDLKTQLSVANGQFQGVNRIGLWKVLGWLILYLLVVGPLDYFLVRNIFKKPQLTWITLPTWVALAGFIAGVGSLNSNAGNLEMQHNQVDITDYDLLTGSQLGESYITLYSAETRRYHLEVKASPQEKPFALNPATTSRMLHLNWTGNPEVGFGGMYREGNVAFGGSKYGITSSFLNSPSSPSDKMLAAKVDALPIRIWSTRELKTNWHRIPHSGESFKIPMTAKLKGNSSGQLTGTLQSHFSSPISNWLVIYQNRIYFSSHKRGDKIPPESRWSLQNLNYVRTGLSRKVLKGTSSRIVQNKSKSNNEEEILSEDNEYLLSESDTMRILQLLSFYQMLDGKSYTALDDNVLKHLDLSHLVKLNRAIFLGELSGEQDVTLSINGTDHKPTRYRRFVRVIIPIEKVVEKTKYRDLFEYEKNSQ